MDIVRIRKIGKLVLISMFADDVLFETFVLKGGSAIDLAYGVDSRASVDIDLSLESDFIKEELDEIIKRIKHSLNSIFDEEGFVIFDFDFRPRPLKPSSKRPEFWGGYSISFKIISKERKHELKEINKARTAAEPVNLQDGKKFTVDISKYEYCKEVQEAGLDGYTIVVYTPKMLVIEKLRAICQQMAEYKHNKGRTKMPRR